MSLLLLLRRWLAAPAGQVYTLRGSLRLINRATGALRRVGGPAGSVAALTRLDTGLSRVRALGAVTLAARLTGGIARV